MPSYASIGAALLFTAYGQLILKARALVQTSATGGSDPLRYLGAMFADPWALSGWGAAVAAGCAWMLAVEKTDLAYAYPFMALSFVLVPLGASVLLGERLPGLRLAGLGLIVVGVTLSALAR